MNSHNLATRHFSPQEIVSITAEPHRLYGAVIQYIEAQDHYWLRPLCLVTTSPTGETPISLHRTADIIIASHQLQAVLDTEVLHFWSFLYDDSGEYRDNLSGRHLLQKFLRNLTWP